MTGPLTGVRVVELSAIGPAPFAGMLLADLGAEVIRVGRLAGDDEEAMRPTHGVLNRGRRWMQLDLKQPEAQEAVRKLAATADVLTEGFRPGVAERLGLGPEALLAINPRLVYGRMTGWGQTGPRAATAGHDLGYIALSGALAPCVAADGTPTQPLNMLGDFGGGGMLLAVGVLSALWSAARTGEGQVVDAAIVDGAALLTGMHQAMLASGLWAAAPGGNVFDGGAPFYGSYRTADGRWLSVAAMEPKFYGQLLQGLELDLDPAAQLDQSSWPATRSVFASRIAEKTRDEWIAAFDGLDACVAPVLEPAEVTGDPHLADREVYVERDGLRHPAPAPRFSHTPTTLPADGGADETATILHDLGYTDDQLTALADAGAIKPADAGPKGNS
ncbi:CaiB/BaiF CoA transferase family protein [Flexivirga meconopsidis]|uniref:CaiB/BaiF CoA transferase family protein n=1 Tax=Flexivirga meconopsidis TaxID=2977121 RepID=UPI00223FB02D